MRPIRALKVLRQWGQDSPVAACGGRLPMTRDLRDMRFNLEVMVHCASCAAAPFLIAPRHAGRSWARVSHEVWSMPKSFRETFRVSLNHFFWPPWEREWSHNGSLAIALNYLLLRHNHNIKNSNNKDNNYNNNNNKNANHL